MSLINPITPPVVDVPTAQAKQLAMVKRVINEIIGDIMKQFPIVFDSMWNNKMGLTPQQAFDALGTDAVQLIIISNGLQQLVNTLVPNLMNFSVPTGWTMVPNQDGTVTVTKAS